MKIKDEKLQKYIRVKDNATIEKEIARKKETIRKKQAAKRKKEKADKKREEREWPERDNPDFEDELALLYGYFSDDIDGETSYEFVNIDAPKGKIIIRHNCDKCNNHEWAVTKISFLHLGSRCPVCQESKGETKVRNFLLENNIIFKRQFGFNDLHYGKLKFDFAIFSNEDRLVPLFLIEFDGEFHYLNIFGEEKLKDSQQRDLLKNEYCKEHNINLIRIPYWEKENIEKILEKKIFGIEQ